MNNPADSPEPIMDEAWIRKVIEEMGGPRAINEGLREFRRRIDRLWQERPVLLEKYPDKWVAMGNDGLVAVGDSIDDVLREAENQGIRRGDVVVDYLERDPPVLIL